MPNAKASNVCLAVSTAVVDGFYSINLTLLLKNPNLKNSLPHVDIYVTSIQNSIQKRTLLNSTGAHQNLITAQHQKWLTLRRWRQM